MGKHSTRHIYLKLLKEMEEAKDHLDKVNMRIHELLDLIDEADAERIQEQHQMWMDEADNDNDR